MQLTLDILDKIAGRRLGAAARTNAAQFIAGLDAYGDGLNQPHRMAQYLAQNLHESGVFKFDREIASGEAYEGRADLGNTQPGDGKRFKGRTPTQVTGRANYRGFRDWCRKRGLNPPDFERDPEAILEDPWEGLAPLWYWETRKLNRYADEGDLMMITRKINGGYNGLDDRVRWYTRAALVLLGRAPGSLKDFQRGAGLAVDGIAGPRTLSALHKALVSLTAPQERAQGIMAAPVVAEKAVVPKELDKPQTATSGFWERLGTASAGIATVGAALQGLDWKVVAVCAGAAVVGLAVYGLIHQRRTLAKIQQLKVATDGL